MAVEPEEVRPGDPEPDDTRAREAAYEAMLTRDRGPLAHLEMELEQPFDRRCRPQFQHLALGGGPLDNCLVDLEVGATRKWLAVYGSTKLTEDTTELAFPAFPEGSLVQGHYVLGDGTTEWLGTGYVFPTLHWRAMSTPPRVARDSLARRARPPLA